MNNLSTVKLEPIDFDNDHIAASTKDLTVSMPNSNRMKRSRKAAHPSRNIKSLVQPSLMNQLTETTSHMQIDEPSTTLMTFTDDDDDDELSNLPRFDPIDEQENNHESDINTNKRSSNTQQHQISSKRPRLSYNKRLEANARERERVHNLTAAFEALRKVIPMYGDQPKLSRLSILRIACSYVHVLGALNEIDFSQGQNAYTLNESFHMLSCTILNELKRKKNS